jgi:hypothetical protein
LLSSRSPALPCCWRLWTPTRWRNKKKPADPSGTETILDSTTSPIDRHRVELTAGILIGEDDEPRLTRSYIDSLDSSSVDWNRELRSGDHIVGSVHTHPGGGNAQHFSTGDIATGKDLLSQARSQSAVYPVIGVLLYLVQPKDQSGGVLVYNVGARRDRARSLRPGQAQPIRLARRGVTGGGTRSRSSCRPPCRGR